MADVFVMPKLGLTMESGTIVGWLVDDDVDVEPGQPVLIIETDKVESEVEATKAGRLHRVGEVGQEYHCGVTIGWFLAAGEEPPPSSAEAPLSTASLSTASLSTAPLSTAPVAGGVRATSGIGGRLLASPNARRLAAARGVDLWSVSGSGPGGRITSEDVPDGPSPSTAAPPRATAAVPSTAAPLRATAAVPSAAAPAAPARRGSTRSGAWRLATAAARNLADLLGVDIAEVTGTGADPRVTREDVAAYVRAALSEPVRQTVGRTTTVLPPPLQEPSAVIPLKGMRGIIADRVSASLQSMAQLTLTMDVDMHGVVADRAMRGDRAAAEGLAPGYTDYVIAAAAAALGRHPQLNSQMIDGGVALLPQVNIGMAVAIDGGLIVPVIHDTASLGLDELAAETSRLAAAARSGKLTLPELEGGTFSVTALGMFGVDSFTPIINAPNTAILGVGRLRDDVALSEDGTPVRVERLTLSLTWDHRAFDGAPAAEFARSVKAILEAH